VDDPIIELAQIRSGRKTPPPSDDAQSARPVVKIIGGQLPRAIDAAEQVIATSDPEIFEFAGHPVYLGRNRRSKTTLSPIAAA